LQAAIARHGLEGLQVYPPAGFEHAEIRSTPRSLMGVRLQEAALRAGPRAAPPAVDRSPEGEACRRAFGHLVEDATGLAAVAGNLERLSLEYRRAVRRARALQDVLLPEIDRDVYEIETRLEELEQRTPYGCGRVRVGWATRMPTERHYNGAWMCARPCCEATRPGRCST
jgi:V/A-type H+-transporting ATPase subunit D